METNGEVEEKVNALPPQKCQKAWSVTSQATKRSGASKVSKAPSWPSLRVTSHFFFTFSNLTHALDWNGMVQKPALESGQANRERNSVRNR